MKNFRNSLKGIFAVAGIFRWRILVSVLIGVARIALSLGFVWVSKELIDIATGVSSGQLNVFVAVLAGVMVLRILCNLAASYWENLTMVKAQNRLRLEAFTHTLYGTWNGKEDYHSADVLNRLQEDVRVMVELVCSRIPEIVITLLQLIAASVYLIAMAPQLLGLLLGLMVVGIFGSKMFYRTIRKLSALLRELDSRCQQHIQENLRNRVLVLTLTGVEKTIGKLDAMQDEIERNSVSRLNYNAVARGFMGFGFMAGYAAAFLWGVYGISGGTVTYGMMTAFLQLVGQVQRPMADLSKHIPAFIQATASEERLSVLLALERDIPCGGELLDAAPAIEFKNVNFAYPGRDSLTVENFSHVFGAGTLTVVTGPTGRGKSTLVRLAMGLLKPLSGTISKIPISNFMYVPQGNSLMSGTIRENLLLADESADEGRMREALHTAVADFVFDLPDGLDTVCGESGSGLSEGQAQRIAIARSLLHTGTVLILDEATSALDNETEECFLSRLADGYRGSKTIIFISHRSRAIEYADAVLELK